MDVVSFGGKEYVKASVIARDLGYTADYVGQLCRSNKVKARLVGRSWFVERGSIQDHKTNRYRSTQAKSKEVLREVVHLKTKEAKYSHLGHQKLHVYATPSKVSYLQDDSELIPLVGSVNKTERAFSSGLSDVHRVDIARKSPQETLRRPGDAQNGVSPAETKKEGHETSPKNMVISSSPRIPLQKDHNKSVAPTKSSRSQVGASQAASIPAASSKGWLLIMLSLTSSLLAAFVAIGLEANLWIIDGQITTTYGFEISRFFASIQPVYLKIF